MSDKFQNKYRIPPARAQWWDYSNAGAYFVTICTSEMECYFGEVINGEITLSLIGEIVKFEWLKTFEMRPDMNLEIGEYVVMPNHFHAIIIIGNNEYNKNKNNNIDMDVANRFGTQAKNLASIMRGFKSAVTRKALVVDPNFGWQSRYHEHIIRNTESFENITKYIINNPDKWMEDRFFR